MRSVVGALSLAGCIAVVLVGAGSAGAQAVVSGTAVEVAAQATDNVGVAGVQFYLDGELLGAELHVAPYRFSWDTTTRPNGAYTLTARARDLAGNQALSPPVAVVIDNGPSDTTPPFGVTILSPSQDQTVSGTETISATASDDIGVALVRFRVDGVTISTDTVPPYSVSWNTTTSPNGSATVTALAEDAAGNQTVSPPVTVLVSNSPSSDQDPPYDVVVVEPANGATMLLNQTIIATASDSVGVAGVQFIIDDQISLGIEDTTPPYSVNWYTGSTPNGQHTITARARDAAGNTTTSSAVVVTVLNGASTPPPPDVSPPSVSVSSALSGATVSGSVVVTAQATDDTAVAGVQFLLDGAPLGAEDSSAPYRVTWDTTALPDGPYTLAARARDEAGNETISAPVSVTVSNPPAPDPDSDPDESETASMGDGIVRLSIAPSGVGFRRIQAHTDGGDRMELYLDGQRVAEAGGRTLSYDWDVRPLVGLVEVRVVTLEGSGLVASTSLFYQVASTDTRSVRLEIAVFPILGADYIQAAANVADPVWMELDVDGERRVVQGGAEVEYAWAHDSGGVAEIVFAVYDDTGVVASVQMAHAP